MIGVLGHNSALARLYWAVVRNEVMRVSFVHCFGLAFFLKNSFILHHLERGTKPMLTSHNNRFHNGLSGIRTCDHQHEVTSSTTVLLVPTGLVWHDGK